MRGVIDSEDLPLNVSREILQQNRVMSQIRQSSVKKVLSELAALSKHRIRRNTRSSSRQFNRPLKEGLYSDYQNREALLGLVRFKSSQAEGWTSLADYRLRAKEGQKSVYYITGGEEDRLRKSPLLEIYRKRGFEVLVCPDEIDEIVMQALGPFEGMDFKAVNRSGSEAELGGDDTAGEASADEGVNKAILRAKAVLGEAVKDVRLSKRLAESPSCVVLDADDPSMRLRELLKGMGGADLPDIKPILELNGNHALVRRLADATDAEAEDLARVLLGQALLVEGAALDDPVDFTMRLNRLLKA